MLNPDIKKASQRTGDGCDAFRCSVYRLCGGKNVVPAQKVMMSDRKFFRILLEYSIAKILPKALPSCHKCIHGFCGIQIKLLDNMDKQCGRWYPPTVTQIGRITSVNSYDCAERRVSEVHSHISNYDSGVTGSQRRIECLMK